MSHVVKFPESVFCNDSSSFARRGTMFILSSPSGVGKTTLAHMLIQNKALDLTLSISATTRPKRSREIEGVHYHFISLNEFLQQRDSGEFYEWAEVHGNFYSSPRRFIEDVLQQGRDVLFDIDYQGAQQIQQKAPQDSVTLFILPPSLEELRRRLEQRAEDGSEIIMRRIQNARHELEQWSLYDYILVNQDLDTTHLDLAAVIRAEQLKRQNRPAAIEHLVQNLLRDA